MGNNAGTGTPIPTTEPAQNGDRELNEFSDNESEITELGEEDIENKARYLCANINMCFTVCKLAQQVKKHETDDMKRLFGTKDADGVRNFYVVEKRNIYKERYPREKMNQMYRHWPKLKWFSNLQEYGDCSTGPEANSEHTKLTVDCNNKLSDKERLVLDELLTFRTDAESYAAFRSFLEKCDNFETDKDKKRKLFRSMLIERLVKKNVRKLEMALGLDYDDAFTDFKQILAAVQKRKHEIDQLKAKLNDDIFKKCPDELDFYSKLSHYVENVMKRAKRRHLLEEMPDHYLVGGQSHLAMVRSVLNCMVTYENEQTTPLALLCEYATIEMWHALLGDTEGLDVWPLLSEDPSVWTSPVDKSNGTQGEGPSLLHYAAMNPSADILRYLFDKQLVSVGDLSRPTSRLNTPLHLAAHYSSVESVNFLFEKGCSHLERNKLGETPLHLAASGGDLDTFNQVYRMHPEEEACLLDEAKFGQPLLYAAKNNHLECMGTILDKQAEADATVHDEECDTALHYISKEASTRWLAKLLKANALLGEKNEVGNSPVDWISYARLKALLDEHTSIVKLKRIKGDTSRKDHTEVIFTNFFGHHASGSDMKNIMAIAQAANAEAPGDEQPKNLCLHPLCQAIVSVKWQKVRKFFFLKLAFFLPFVFFLSLHPILQMQRDLRTDSHANDSSTISDEQYSHWIEFSLRGTHLFLSIQLVSGMLSLFVLTLPFLKKSAAYVNYKKCNTRRVRRLLEFYWEELLWSDWYEYVLWVIAFMHLSDAISPIVVVIASWFSLFYVCSNHPSILPLRYMLVRILLRYIKFLIFSLGLIGGFALGFFLLVNKCKLDSNHEGVCAEGFDTLYLTMLKVPSMMMGEISFESFKFEASAHLQFLFGSFIFLVTCCLFNMMNGLAINITTELEKKAHVFSTIAQCEMIIEFEALLKQMSSWLEYLHLPGKNAINSVWVERIKVQPSTGECKNLEPYDKREHLNAPEEDLWETNDHRRAEWVWMNRGFTLDSAIVRAGLECSERNVYKDPADIEFSLDFAREDEEGDDGINEEADTLIPLVTKPSVQAPFDALGSDEPK